MCSAMRLQIRSVDVPTITSAQRKRNSSLPKIPWDVKDNPKYTQSYPSAPFSAVTPPKASMITSG